MKKRMFPVIHLFVMLVVIFGSWPATPALAKVTRAQPILVQMAAQQPDQLVRVIVQKASEAAGVEEHVASRGGQVTRDLGIINAFAAEMTAEAAVNLARSEAIRWVSLDAPVVENGGLDGTVNTANLLNAYDRAIRADALWAQGYQGSSMTVAILDSGVNNHNDFKSRVLTRVKTNSYPVTVADNYGHGTHIAGIIAGNGANSAGKYIGVAPKVKLVSVKVSDDTGMALTSDAVAGLEWILQNKQKYGIRVVSISLNSTVAESYHTSPLDAACEILWFNGIVVVVSGGNNGSTVPGILYPPANDPFIISVGAVDDKGTGSISDDRLASFSAFGSTESGFSKPDLVAPGRNIISPLSSSGSLLPTTYPANKVGSAYFKMSGTSMSAPMVAGAVALLLQDEPNLTPDQVKYRLMSTANKNWSGYNAAAAGAGYLDVYAAVHGTSTQSANTGVLPSQLLTTGTDPITFGSVGWNSVGWNSVGWNSVGWNSDYWGP